MNENKERVFGLVNKLLSHNTNTGKGLEMCDFIDEVVYGHLGYLCTLSTCLSDRDFEPIQAMTGLKDFFRKIDEIINEADKLNENK